MIYLASQSPRRRQLLEQIGVAHELLLPNTDGDIEEDVEALEAVRRGEPAQAYAERVTLHKLAAARVRRVRRGLEPAPILAADTTVALGRRILGKPRDAVEAAAMLEALAGRTHRVITAIALWSGRRTLRATSVSRVRFAALSRAQIDAYVAGGEPFGKAGAYAIQSAAAAWIEHMSGSYSGVMGLPLYETARLLERSRRERIADNRRPCKTS